MNLEDGLKQVLNNFYRDEIFSRPKVIAPPREPYREQVDVVQLKGTQPVPTPRGVIRKTSSNSNGQPVQ